jgi:hypothetical protein
MSTSKFEDHLWREFVREHGDDLSQLRRPPTRQGFHRPRVAVGAGLGLAGGATALALVLSVASAPPAFAVTLNHNGTVTVTIRSASAIAGVNAKLHQLGIRAKVMAAAPVGCQALSVEVPTGTQNTYGTAGTTGTPSTTWAQWTFNQSAASGAQSVVLTPPSADNNLPTADQSSSSIWTCGGAVAAQPATGVTSPSAGAATGSSGTTGNSGSGVT